MELVRSLIIRQEKMLQVLLLSDIFDRVRKIKIDGIQAVCGGKNKEAIPEYAIGYTTGQIKIMELSSKNTCKAEFAAGELIQKSLLNIQ